MTLYQTLDPTTAKIIAKFPNPTALEISEKLDSAQRALTAMKSRSPSERATSLSRVAKLLETRKKHLAELMALEMGKPLEQGEAEIEKCARTFSYFAKESENWLADKTVHVDEGHAVIIHEAVGTIFAIMPWNFPFWQIVRVAAPALAAGNTLLLKPASNVPQCGLAIEALVNESFGIPALQTIFANTEQSTQIIADSRVHMITLTGSERAGSIVAATAGKHIKKVVLELGGSDPFIVLEDASLEKCIETAVQARLINGGQSCIAAKRFLVQKTVFSSFVSGMVNEMKNITMGSPFTKGIKLGPLATLEQRDTLTSQVEDALEKGAKIHCGGKLLDGDGFFFPPTVLTDITKDMKVYNEEVFGPVAIVLPFSSDAEALSIANDSEFGLGASIWTHNAHRAEHLAKGLEVGFVCINDMVRSDFRLPFGGKKKSGFGRELGHEGLMEYVSTKTIVTHIL